MGAEELPHYAWYRPWGFTSQGAFDAVVVQRYMALYGLTKAELGMVSVAQRQWARLNPRAIMQAPMTLEDYLASPYIVEPLRLPDYCMVADGGVALILAPVELAKLPAVVVAGLGWGEDNAGSSHLRSKLAFNRQQVRLAADRVYEESGLGPGDIDLFLTYDNFSSELFYTLENCGYAREGESAAFIRAKGIGPGGCFPVNTSGGMLSEAYMQGFSAQVEAVRQLRWQAGRRQVPSCRHAHYISNTIGKASGAIYRRLD
jgi:acetyl-CoA acetyltransferase